MSRNGVGSSWPFCTIRIRPVFSTMNRRASPAGAVRCTGLLKPDATTSSFSGASPVPGGSPGGWPCGPLESPEHPSKTRTIDLSFINPLDRTSPGTSFATPETRNEYHLRPRTPNFLVGGQSLRRRIVDIGARAGADGLAVAFYDYRHRTGWGYHADQWFHAASTIKVPVLLGVFSAIEQGKLQAYSRVHVRNRFLSAADGKPFRVDSDRDSNAEVYAALGKTMQIRE